MTSSRAASSATIPAVEERILVTLDGDFAELIYVHEAAHAGLVRLTTKPETVVF